MTMLKWIYKVSVTIFMGLGLLLAGCASQQSATTGNGGAASASAAYPAAGSNVPYPGSSDPGAVANGQLSLPLSMQAGIFYPLALGTLNLEGTDLAVTSEQAATLLSLWQALDSLVTSGNATTADLDAAFQQIQNAMTAEQMQAIQSMDLSGQNMQALAQKLGIAMPAGQATLTPEQQAAIDAAGTNGQPPAGTPGPGGPGGFLGAQSTPMPGGPQGMGSNGAPPAPGIGGGFETNFYQAVIDLLQQKTQ
jgi:hypothetical protein